MPSGQSWSVEQVDLLRRLWSQGETSAVIAAHLGGPSRSAVLGKIFRLRLRAEGATTAVKGRQRAAGIDGEQAGVPTRRRRRPRSKQTPPPQPIRQHRTLLELTNTTCRWPHGRPGVGNFFFCGAPEADLERGIPYCARHMLRAYPASAGVKATAPAALVGASRR
jgi:GcrA cell cycle regulator